MKTQLEKPGSYPRPGWMGRSVRVAAGIFILYLTVPGILFHHNDVIRTGWDATMVGWVFSILISIHLLPVIVDRGFGVRWGRRSQFVFALLFIAALALDFTVFGALWGPPAGMLVVLTTGFVLGHLGLSFLVAGLFATPG